MGGHRGQLYELLKIWSHDDKKFRELHTYLDPILAKAESGKYKLLTFKKPDEEKEATKRALHALSFAFQKTDIRLELVSIKSRDERPELDLRESSALWMRIEKHFGVDPWHGDDIIQKSSIDNASPPWPMLGQKLRTSIEQSFRPGLHNLLVNNIWNSAYYFLAFALIGNTAKASRLKPLLRIMADTPPLGIKKYTDDVWYVLVG